MPLPGYLPPFRSMIRWPFPNPNSIHLCQPIAKPKKNLFPCGQTTILSCPRES
uniref:Uncharacterized protein n=1 Tax=Anguilla anguilla TaxID=7936 RepID=A0A0E9PV40_ANGAN